MLVVGRVNLRDQRLEARSVDHEMQMCRPEVVAAGGPHQFSDRSVDRNRIARRHYAPEIKAPGFVGNKTPAQIHLGLPGILVLVEPLRRRMPDIDFGTRDWTPVSIFEGSANDKSRTGCR